MDTYKIKEPDDKLIILRERYLIIRILRLLILPAGLYIAVLGSDATSLLRFPDLFTRIFGVGMALGGAYMFLVSVVTIDKKNNKVIVEKKWMYSRFNQQEWQFSIFTIVNVCEWVGQGNEVFNTPQGARATFDDIFLQGENAKLHLARVRKTRLIGAGQAEALAQRIADYTNLPLEKTYLEKAP
ncbi:MAG: hypothetical protein OEW89_02510 [Gammaproteobacteria bacterium]|nr:hypothetical protein [Gammaproteobacteria bacterium]